MERGETIPKNLSIPPVLSNKDEEMQKEYTKHLKHYDFTLQLHQ